MHWSQSLFVNNYLWQVRWFQIMTQQFVVLLSSYVTPRSCVNHFMVLTYLAESITVSKILQGGPILRNTEIGLISQRNSEKFHIFWRISENWNVLGHENFDYYRHFSAWKITISIQEKVVPIRKRQSVLIIGGKRIF